ncbi:MAG: extracellular solute-binding protein [Lachnospiraceae bacterium]|nr:extracellular solute-binding protein [Lachnospiraceae bacterium]
MYQRKFIKLIVLLGILTIFFAGCGKRNPEESVVLSESATKTYTINSRTLELNTDAFAINRNFQIIGNTLYFQSNDQEGAGIYYEPIDREGDLQKMPIDFGASEMLLSFVVDKENNAYCFLKDEKEQYFLRTYTSQGIIMVEQDITTLTLQNQEDILFAKTVIDESGTVYAMAKGSIWLFDKDGLYLGRVELPSKNILDMVSGTDGKVYISYNSEGDIHIYLAKVDVENKKFGEPFSFQGSGKLYPGTKAKIITYDARYLYEMDGFTGEYTAILDLAKHYIKAGSICAFSVNDTKKYTFVLNLSEDKAFTINKLELITLEESVVANSVSDVEKTEIRLVAPGTDGEDTYLLNFIMEFNKQSEKYTVTYESLGLASEEDFALFINSRLVSEDCPDLLLINYFMYETYADAGALEDLTPYIEQSSLITTEDYLENAVAPYRSGEAIYGIPKILNVQGWIGKKSQVESLYKKMTVDYFLDFLEKNPTAKFEYDGEYCGLLRTCMKFGLDEYVDFEKGICSFDQKEFKDLMLRIKNTNNAHAVTSGQWDTLLKSDEILLSEVHLYDFYTLEKYAMDYGEELLFLGYPSPDGSLAGEVRPEASLGIAANSPNKEGAWEFLKYYLLNYHVPHGIPADEYSFEKEWNEAKTPKYEEDENGELEEVPVSQFFYQGDMVPLYAMSEENAEHIHEVIESALPVSKDAQTIQNIIFEESSAYFYGQKTLEETVDIIQNRCQLYLDESR